MQSTLTRSTQTVPESRWSELQSRIQGSVISPDDAQYDQARQAWNLAFDHRPAVIVMAMGVMDVVEAVQFGVCYSRRGDLSPRRCFKTVHASFPAHRSSVDELLSPAPQKIRLDR